MQRFGMFGAGLLLGVVSVLFFPYHSLASGPNLIPNSGVETAGTPATTPVQWHQDAWGSNNAAFSYPATGHASGHSVSIQMTNWKTGDAKWYADPVSVQANTDYTFSDFYQSSVQTSIVAMSLSASGTPTYFDIATQVPASPSAWKQASFSFHTLASTKTLTIFHLIKKNGTLNLDDESLTENGNVAPPGLVPNPSLENPSATNNNLPDQWSHSKWGSNTPTYQYANNGHTGNRSVKLTITNYKSGDAKWVYTPKPLERGKDYQFNAWYKTNTIPHVVAQYIKDDGSEDFFGLPDPEPTGTDWQNYSGVFSVPQDVKAVSLFFFLSNNGWVQTDDYQVSPYTYQGFDKGRVTLTFDDGFEQNVTTVLPVLDQYGFKATQCDATQYVEGIPDQIANAKKFAADGQELCSHTVTHPWLTQIPTSQIDYELSHSQQFLQSITGQPITDFASPYGDYNAAVNTEIKKYFTSHRTTDEGFNSKDSFNPYRLKVQNMQTTTTLAQFQAWVNKAKADHTWLILIYHVVDTGGLEQFDTYKPDFDTQMSWLAQSGVTVERWDKALSEISTQLH